jgi:hypothetical protein
MNTYQDSQSSQYDEIIKNLKKGNIVPFIGAGIEPDVYIKFAMKLADKARVEAELPQSNQNNKKDAKEQEKELIRKLVGVPCYYCHYQISRPDNKCPMLEGIDQECPLYKEQQLAVAKMHIRSFSEYLNFTDEPNFVNNCYKAFEDSNTGGPMELHNFLVKDISNILQSKKLPERSPGFPFQVIVTTNYDNNLEEVFSAIKKNYDIISYTINNKGNLNYFKLTRVTFDEEKRKDDPENLELDKSYDKFELRPSVGNVVKIRPVILKLYGSWNDKTQFAVTEDQISPLIQIISDKLPENLQNIITKSYPLFLGYSLNDFDLELIIKMFWEKQNLPLPDPIWLVNQAQPSDLTKKFWEKNRRDLKKVFIDASVDNFIKEVTKRINSM